MNPRLFVLIVLTSLISACSSGSGNSTPPPPVTYTIGGTISGLSGTGLVLQDNGGNNLSISANQTSFTFTTPVPSGGMYNVTVFTQAAGPEPCAITNGSGTANANVTGVQVACAAASAPNEWTWMNGANGPNQNGVYGTQGSAASGNAPGARSSAVSWTDASGNLWLFGGLGYDATGTHGYLNDLWRYSAGEWTWMGGPSVANQKGIYGTQGMAASGNVPGARYGAVSWNDAAGNLWLFGGNGLDSAGANSNLNDLWKYSAGEWTWMSGANLAGPFGPLGVWGTQGTAAPANVPSGRYLAVSWSDTAGNLWLFGGVGYGIFENVGYLNDLWRYSAGEWTWMSGSNGIDQSGTYGTQGVASPSNAPGARVQAASWIDADGNFWLFGGVVFLSFGAGDNDLNDLWKYSAGEWTWMSGSSNGNQPGTYGTLGTPAPGNVPGSRANAVSWTDASGNLWLFGGFTYYSSHSGDYFNDLWKYSAGEWTWMSGLNVEDGLGVYGNLGAAASGNMPGSRASSANWRDAGGNLWIFGGIGEAPSGNAYPWSDLWKYEP